MKHTLEKHLEYIKLAKYFKKIETLAEKMGVDVDDLVQERQIRNSTIYTSFKKNVLTVAQKRIATIKKLRNNDTAGESPIVNLTILQKKNEDY